ncbi:hypothetical protein INS49_005163 [Diaporthe citri]|uniref:uncharacterized protein n=1 Tax=Diaporthe citri TaxID=83186 RepID=UPI001C80890E|nr:uncharacterized protein INS49_005163 [Diaporthe citri]KAG6353906.1 hypothetical protein INS49_005163 [Diaporthe citri]
MGRWGHCLFGHDAAIGHAIKIIKDITQGDDRQFAHMVDRVLVGSPLGVLGYYAEEYSLLEKIQGQVDESVVSVAMAPLADCGFRGPGKRQFLSALDNYQAGKPRSFHQPSCHGCGKVDSDIKAEGKTLLKCGGCKNEIAAAWFCDKDCQRGLWKHHKRNCGAPLGHGIATYQIYGKCTLGFNIYEGANV